MAKKANSSAMKDLLGYFDAKEFEVVVFEQRMIFEDPVESWPIVDALIAFYSTGFPQSRAEEYVALRSPFLVNDLVAQRLLRDRRKVYEICVKNEIPVPNHIIINRDGCAEFDQNSDRLIEEEGYVELDGKRINKPFVEKPVDADDHNVYIYYPRILGGGRKELFRKVGDRSSEYYPDREKVRREGSYIYEEFLTTHGTDVKAYAVTGGYVYAEARKSPTIDGRVIRDEKNNEVRFPITLTPQEKELAVKICISFAQRVCGFDLLRTEDGNTFVCDVNGWSFVKNSAGHYRDTAMLLSRIIKNSLGRGGDLHSDVEEELESVLSETTGADQQQQVSTPPKREKTHEELRAVFAIIRHGDRTPKQKIKMKTSAKQFLALLPEGQSEIKLKTATDLSNVLRIINELLEELPPRPPTPFSAPDQPKSPSSSGPDDEEIEEQLLQARAVLEIGGSFKGINRKVQIKASKSEDDTSKKEVLVIIKWGGVLTPEGRSQAEELGRSFRERIYPGVDGLLRLHSTYRHDLKIYASDEGRVQVSAAAFAKGLLNLEGHLTPILASLVRKGGDVNQLLDDCSAAQEEMEKAKTNVRNFLQPPEGEVMVVPSITSVKTACGKLRNDIPGAMEKLYMDIKNLTQQLKVLVRAIRRNMPKPVRGSAAATVSHRLNRSQSEKFPAMDGGSAAASLGVIMSGDGPTLDRGDGAITIPDMLQLCYGRWEKLSNDFYKAKTKSFDVSKIPDIYDSAKYDVIHNRELLALDNKYLHSIYLTSKLLAEIVVPQEYGHSPEEKFTLGAKIAKKLVQKIRTDTSGVESDQDGGNLLHRLDTRFAKELGIKSTDRRVLTRLYFTSESHMHSLLNVLRFAHLASGEVSKLAPNPSSLREAEAVEELDYLSQIIFRIFEVTQPDNSRKFIVRVAFSSGIHVHTTLDPTTQAIQKVEVGEQSASSSSDNGKKHIVKALPPASPLIYLWNDLEIHDFYKLLDFISSTAS